MKYARQILIVILAAATAWFCLVRPHPPVVHVLADQWITVDEITRGHTVVVPQSRKTPAPLVLAYHGTGDTAQSMSEYSQLNHLAAEHGFIVVYPSTVGQTWDTRPVRSGSENLDLKFFDKLLPQLITVHNIDSRRVYAVGMSNGATFVHHLPTCRSLQLAAIVAHSGTPPQLESSSDRRVPTMIIVGDLDPAYDSIVLDASRHDLPCTNVSGLAHEWSVKHNTEMWQFLSQFTGHTESH